MLTAICGRDFDINMGNLKTYTMTLLAKLNYDMGSNVYSNYSLSFPYKPITNFSNVLYELRDLRKATLLIDEASVYFDAYMPPNKHDGSSQFKRFARQTRKREIQVYYTAQSFFDVHRSIRKVTQNIIATRKLHDNFKICRSDTCREPHILELTMCKIGKDEELYEVTKPKYFRVIPEIFDLYDSEEVIDIE